MTPELDAGAGSPTAETIRYRPVTIVDASEPKRLDLRVEVPVEDMAATGRDRAACPAVRRRKARCEPSIWSAIHPALLKLVREHRSTLIFVNSRRLAERISGAINDLAEQPLVRAHHGSVSVGQRKEIEELLKSGQLRGLVATSSLELGIDMGAVDLVVQIEAPPSVASGMQRIGRASHQVGAVSKGLIFPKYRADLVACAAVTQAMQDGEVEAIRYPRNALDVLAQQIVATGRDGNMERGRAVRFRARAALRSPRCRVRSSMACSTCSPAAIRRMNSRNCGRASPGTAWRTR